MIAEYTVKRNGNGTKQVSLFQKRKWLPLE